MNDHRHDAHADGLEQRRLEVEQLLASADQQLADLRQMREGLNDDDEHDPDGVSLSSEWSRLEGLRQNRIDQLAAIDAAAERLAEGTDAVCTVCGGPIAPERLEVRPEATTCIDCAQQQSSLG